MKIEHFVTSPIWSWKKLTTSIDYWKMPLKNWRKIFKNLGAKGKFWRGVASFLKLFNHTTYSGMQVRYFWVNKIPKFSKLLYSSIVQYYCLEKYYLTLDGNKEKINLTIFFECKYNKVKSMVFINETASVSENSSPSSKSEIWSYNSIYLKDMKKRNVNWTQNSVAKWRKRNKI